MQFRDEVLTMKRDRLKDALDRGYEDVAARRLAAADYCGFLGAASRSFDRSPDRIFVIAWLPSWHAYS